MRRMALVRSRSELGSGLTVAASVCAIVLSAQSQQPIRVGTNFVRVDAYPTKDGRIVEGLVAADFEVLEDGVPQKIDSFEHILPVARSADGAHAAELAARHAAGGRQPAQPYLPRLSRRSVR